MSSRAKPRDLSKKTIPFKESNRYFRGKIINLLREKNMNETEIQKIIQKPKQYVNKIISSLMKDELVERKNGRLQLPN
jgi:predicted transcriptional regulator